MDNRVSREVIAALSEALGLEARPADSFTELGLDSLRLAELARELEGRFGIPIDQEILDVETVADLIEYVEARAGDARR